MKKLYKIIFMVCLVIAGYQNMMAQTVTNHGDTISIANGTILYIKGGLSNADNNSRHSYIKNDGVLNINGDFIKSPNMVYTGNDSLVMSGNAAADLAGLSFGNLIISGGGNKTLTGDAVIRNNIDLTGGNLYTNSFTLTIDSTASLTEDSADYVIGQATMTKYLGQGVKESFGLLGLDIRADSLAPGMTTIVRTTGSHLDGNGNESINRYFDVIPTNNGNTGSTITLHYFDEELNSLAESGLGIFRHRSNNDWESDSFQVRRTDINTIQTRVDTLGVFTAGSISSPLPVELMNFNARLYSPYVSLLTWTTASEINNDYFDVERSENGTDFIKIGEKTGHGTSYRPNNYSYTDNLSDLSATVLYYRLKQVDFNGSYQYSPVRVIDLENQPTPFKVWYNSSVEKAEVYLFYTQETSVQLCLLDMQGKLIAKQAGHIMTGQTQLSFNMASLAPGIYTISVTDQNGINAKRILKY